jgi:hypothetical protein
MLGRLTNLQWVWVGVAGTVIVVGGFVLLSGPSAEPADPIDSTGSTVVEVAPCTVGSAGACGIDTGDGLVLTTDDATIIDNGDGTATVTGSIEVATAAGPIDIDDANLIIGIPPDGGPPEIVGGTGDVPFPTTGFLAQANLVGTSTGLFGVDYGRDIQNLGAFVNPDTKYLWISFSDGMDVSTGFADMFPGVDTSGLPESFSVPLGVQATMVIDPIDPYIYIGGACPAFKTPDSDTSKDEDESETSTTTSSTSTTTTLPEDDDDAPITIGPEEETGDDCGIGFSLNGQIPFTPPDVEGLPDTVTEFAGHIVIRGEVPLGGSGLAIDGVTTVRFGETGYRLDGYGDVAATVPFIKGLIDLEIPLGNAAAGMTVDKLTLSTYAAGAFGGSQEPLVLPLPIPIEIPNEQSSEVLISASIGGTMNADDILEIEPGSSLTIVGTQGLGLGSFGDLLGIELEDFQTTTGTMILDRNGAFIEAEMNASIHPSIDLGAGARLTARVDADVLEDSFIEIVGQMSFAAVALEGESLVRLDSSGLQARGLIETGIGGIEMAGLIGPSGIDLRGNTNLVFPVGVSEQLAADTDGALAGAIAEVEKIDLEIERVTAEIRADRRQRSSDFQSAQSALNIAQAEVDKISGQLATNKARIAVLNGKIKDVCEGKSGLALTACQIANGDKISAWALEIGALETANVALKASLATAKIALDVASAALIVIEDALDAIPVDTDPTIVALNVTRDSAIAVLETTRAVVDTVGTGGTIGGSVDLQIGTSGLGGDANVEWCDTSGCATLAGATLRLDNQFLACIEVFGVPEICAEF